jgi:hypothetical protein
VNNVRVSCGPISAVLRVHLRSQTAELRNTAVLLVSIMQLAYSSTDHRDSLLLRLTPSYNYLLRSLICGSELRIPNGSSTNVLVVATRLTSRHFLIQVLDSVFTCHRWVQILHTCPRLTYCTRVLD